VASLRSRTMWPTARLSPFRSLSSEAMSKIWEITKLQNSDHFIKELQGTYKYGMVRFSNIIHFNTGLPSLMTLKNYLSKLNKLNLKTFMKRNAHV
jgi:hypothetical protein